MDDMNLGGNGNGKGDSDRGQAPGEDDYDWRETYNDCIAYYVTCKEDRTGCDMCESLCMLAARDAQLVETRDYLQNMSMACASGHFMQDRCALSMRYMFSSSAMRSL